VYTVVCVAVPIATPGFHAVTQRDGLPIKPVPVNASPASQITLPRFQQKTTAASRRDCPAGTRKVPTDRPEYVPDTTTANDISAKDLNGAVVGAVSLTLTPLPAVTLTGISDAGTGPSLLITGAAGTAAADTSTAATTAAATTTAQATPAATTTGPTGGTGTAVESGTGDTGSILETCPLSPVEEAALPPDQFGHAAFSDELSEAQNTLSQQEALQLKSDALGGYDFNKLLGSADQLLSDAGPFLGGTASAAAPSAGATAAAAATTPAAATTTTPTTPAAATTTPAAATTTPAAAATTTPAAATPAATPSTTTTS